MAVEEAGTKLLELLFKGRPVGQLLGDGGLANAPLPHESFRVVVCCKS
jgi:hypothetical protein